MLHGVNVLESILGTDLFIQCVEILPKATNLKGLGLLNQEALNVVLSHINSSPKERLKNKSPIEMMRFLNEELLMKFHQFGIQEIEKDKVTLKPYLLKK